MSALEVEGLTVAYAGRHGSVTALADFSLAVPSGRLTVLLGESGCGKTTALNAIAGLIKPSAGRIRLGGGTLFGRDADGRRADAPPNKRDIGIVFQSYALWPHLTVLDNVLYPLRRRGVARAEADRKAMDALALVRCDQLAQRYPGELSGGQQQRIALARAIVARPECLLFDEPLSNLDSSLRRGLRNELARLHWEIGFTGVYVTHDQSEALALGNEVAVMSGGRIVQLGTPRDIYQRPASEFVARFFGANIVPGRVVERAGVSGRVRTPLGLLAAERVAAEDDVVLGIMPQAVEVVPDADGALSLVDARYVGTHVELRLAAGDCEILAIQRDGLAVPAPGARARIEVAPTAVHVFAAQPMRAAVAA